MLHFHGVFLDASKYHKSSNLCLKSLPITNGVIFSNNFRHNPQQLFKLFNIVTEFLQARLQRVSSAYKAFKVDVFARWQALLEARGHLATGPINGRFHLGGLGVFVAQLVASTDKILLK